MPDLRDIPIAALPHMDTDWNVHRKVRGEGWNTIPWIKTNTIFDPGTAGKRAAREDQVIGCFHEEIFAQRPTFVGSKASG